MGSNHGWIERQLAHASDESIRPVCKVSEWLPQRRKTMQASADFSTG